MDDQIDIHSEDSKYSQPSESYEQQQKHVQFADYPIVFKNVHFHFSDKFTNTDFLILNKPKESCLKNSEDYDQFTADKAVQLTKCSVFVFLLLISFLFYIIWWTVSKLLMFEVETQVGDYVLSQMVKPKS